MKTCPRNAAQLFTSQRTLWTWTLPFKPLTSVSLRKCFVFWVTKPSKIGRISPGRNLQAGIFKPSTFEKTIPGTSMKTALKIAMKKTMNQHYWPWIIISHDSSLWTTNHHEITMKSPLFTINHHFLSLILTKTCSLSKIIIESPANLQGPSQHPVESGDDRVPADLLQLCNPLERSTKVLGNIQIPPPLNFTFKWEGQQSY